MLPPVGNPISLSQVNTELGYAANAQISMGNTPVRNLAGVGGGAVDMNSLHGKSSYTQMTAVGNGDYYDSAGGTGVNAYQYSASPYISTLTGGSGGYTFNWVLVSGSVPIGTANLNTANPAMRYNIGKFGSSYFSTYRCDISDNTGHTISVNNITIEIVNII